MENTEKGGRRNIQGKEVACTKVCRGKWREAGGGWAGMKTLGLVKETRMSSIHKNPQKKGFPYWQPWASDLISQSLSIFVWKVGIILIATC